MGCVLLAQTSPKPRESSGEERIDEENEKLLKKHLPNKPKINKELGKAKFNFKKRGKVTKKDEAELTNTHKNIFDWVKQYQSHSLQDKVVEEVVEEEKEDDWRKLELEKEERCKE